MHFNITYQNIDGISIDSKFNLPTQKDFAPPQKSKNNFIKCQTIRTTLLNIYSYCNQRNSETLKIFDTFVLIKRRINFSLQFQGYVLRLLIRHNMQSENKFCLKN